MLKASSPRILYEGVEGPVSTASACGTFSGYFTVKMSINVNVHVFIYMEKIHGGSIHSPRGKPLSSFVEPG